MAILNLPIWTVSPDWRNPVLERLEWKASVLASPTGSEQRFGHRIAPKRTFEMGLTVFGRERALLDLSLGRVGMGEWYLPLWHDGAPLLVDAAPDGMALQCDTTNREFRAGDAALIRDRDALRTETVEIAAVGADGLVLAFPSHLAWPAGSRVYPMRRARLMDSTSLRRRADRAMQGNVIFLCTEPDDWPELEWPVLYGGYGVMTYRPEESADMTMEYQRLTAAFDDEIAAPAVVDISDIGFNIQQHSFWSHGRAQQAELRSIFYALRGRQRPVWVPTFYADLDLASNASAGNFLTARQCGYAAYGGPRTGRQHIRIERMDGTASHHRITSAAETVSGDELLAITPALPSPLAVAAVRRISFMQLCRLDGDSIELSHATDSDGLCTATAAFRSTPETRTAAPWSAMPFLKTTETAYPCGVAVDCVAEGLLAKFALTPQRVAEVTSYLSPWGISHPAYSEVPYYRESRYAVNYDEWTPARISAFLGRSTGWSGTTSGAGDFPAMIRWMESLLTGEGTDLETMQHMEGWCGVIPIAIIETHQAYLRAHNSTLWAANWARFLTFAFHDDGALTGFPYFKLEFRGSDDTTSLGAYTHVNISQSIPMDDGRILRIHENGYGVGSKTVLNWRFASPPYTDGLILDPDGTRATQMDPFADDWIFPAPVADDLGISRPVIGRLSNFVE